MLSLTSLTYITACYVVIEVTEVYHIFYVVTDVPDVYYDVDVVIDVTDVYHNVLRSH